MTMTNTKLPLRTIACALFTLAAFAGHRAAAELPEHVSVAGFGPEGQDYSDEEFPEVEFAYAVAMRNGIAFLGIPSAPDNGHVAVLNQTASGWRRVATLKMPNPAIDTRFGRSITFRDGVVVVGSESAAYVFKRNNGLWKFAQKLTPPAADGQVDFPIALRYEAGTLLASAYRNVAPSVVHVYELDAIGRFVRRATVKASDGTPGDNFGADISMTATTFVVGAPRGGRDRIITLPQFGGPGAAYVFRHNSSGNWVQTQKLQPAVPAQGFGTSVAIDRGMIIVGAPKVDELFYETGGAAYVFLPSSGRYLETLKLQPRFDEHGAYADFGYRIAMFGERIAIAAVEPYGLESFYPFGFVYTYTRDGSSVVPRGVAAGNAVGSSIALANKWLLFGTTVEPSSCTFGCIGSATLYDVNRFRQ
jgi:FG-GAP repeat